MSGVLFPRAWPAPRPGAAGGRRGARFALAVMAATLWVLLWQALYPRLGPGLKAVASARLGGMADFVLTQGGPELLLFLWGLLVVPLVQITCVGRLPLRHQLLVAPMAVLAFAGAAWMDVMLIAREAAQLCPELGGVRIYRRESAPGFYGKTDIRTYAAHGFAWLESRDGQGGYQRHTLTADGPVVERIATPASRYEFRPLKEVPVARGLVLGRRAVLVRETGEILAEHRYLLIGRGWADRLLGLGARFIPARCEGGPPFPGDRPWDATDASLLTATLHGGGGR